MSSDNDNRPATDPAWRYAGWIIGGLFAVVVIAAALAFVGYDPKITSKAPVATTGAGSPAPHSTSN